jgi:hypothetical protein
LAHLAFYTVGVGQYLVVRGAEKLSRENLGRFIACFGSPRWVHAHGALLVVVCVEPTAKS